MTANQQTELNKLCTSAFDSEYLDDKTLAISQHRQAIEALQQFQKTSTDKHRKSVAQKQIKFHNARLLLLRGRSPASTTPIKLLPTAKTASEELVKLESSITMDAWRLSQYQQSRAKNANIQIPDNIKHLLTAPAPLYTPTLPSNAPTVFNVHVSVEMNGFLGGHYFHVKGKDPETQQTLYVLKLLRPLRRQFTSASLFRAAEFTGNPAVVIAITPVDVRKVGSEGSLCGRDFVLQNGLSTIEEKMDRQLKPDWTPKRFSYGGRQFVWRNSADSFLKMGPGDLHEVRRVWPKPGSKTGKTLDEVVPERLSWGKMKARITSMCQISIRGGIDQYFMEYILASQMTKTIVCLRGHD